MISKCAIAGKVINAFSRLGWPAHCPPARVLWQYRLRLIGESAYCFVKGLMCWWCGSPAWEFWVAEADSELLEAFRSNARRIRGGRLERLTWRTFIERAWLRRYLWYCVHWKVK
jgi:hypothetical protein